MNMVSLGLARYAFGRTIDAFPSKSFRYAFRQELLILYAISYIGWRILDFSRSFVLNVAGGFEILEVLSSLPFTILGVVLLLGGFVGIVHSILVDLLPQSE